MNKKNQIKILMAIAALASASIFCSRFTDSGGDDLANSDIYGELFEVVGNVKLRSVDSEKLSDAQEEDKVYIGDQILTFKDSRVRMNLSNGTIIRLSPQSTFVLQEISGSGDDIFAQFYLAVGEMWIILNGGSVNVDTPSGVASVRGSYLHVVVKPNDTVEITCLEGKCSIGNRGGTVNLVAGQIASVTGITNPPQSKIMSHQDVRDWLLANPEATQVIIQLTKTVAALEGESPPAVQSPTTSPTITVTSDITLTPSKTPTATITPTGTAIVCGPSSDWVGYFVQANDTLEGLANAYQIPLSILQFANCMGDQTFIAKGYHIYVPDYATITPTPTITPTRTKTPTPVPVVVVATHVPTLTPTNSPASFQNVVGPTGTLFECNNAYSIDVSEPDGVSSVKVMYAINDNTLASPSYIGLTQNGAFPNTYEGTINIDTYNVIPSLDTVFYHYKVTDSQNLVTYEPALGSPYQYTDAIECGSPTIVTINTAPADASTISVCAQDYSVGVVDPDIVIKVKLEYSIDDSTFASSSFVTFTETNAGVLYDLASYTIMAASGNVVDWRLRVYDTTGDLIIEPASGSYSFTSITCP